MRVITFDPISLPTLQGLRIPSRVLSPLRSLAVLMAMVLRVMLIIPVWNRPMILRTREWALMLDCIPTSTTLCRIEVLELSLMTPTMPTSPPSRPAIRLNGSDLMSIMTATCEMLGTLAGLIVRDLTPNLCCENRSVIWVSMFGPLLMRIDSARSSTPSFFGFRMV